MILINILYIVNHNYYNLLFILTTVKMLKLNRIYNNVWFFEDDVFYFNEQTLTFKVPERSLDFVPVVFSSAVTLSIPFASMSNVTSI